MGKYIDLTGQKFGYLTVLQKTGERTHGKSKAIIWKCVCDCGQICYVSTNKLKSGHTKSCGCYAKKIASDTHRIHGDRQTRLYNIWVRMKQRCENPYDAAYRDYGGRGISVCKDWSNYIGFRNWAVSHGYSDSLTIDRVNNDGNYCPENCRWATRKEQSRNRRNNRYITANGEKHLMEDWAQITGIDKRTIHQRLKRGWSEERAIMQGVSL